MCIKNDGSTFYVGMGLVRNGCLHLRYGSSSVSIMAKQKETLKQKKALLFYSKNAPRDLLAYEKAKNNHENFELFFFPISCV